MFRAGIITVSDKGSQGLRQDLSGPAIAEMLAGSSIDVARTVIVPDEIESICLAIIEFSEKSDVLSGIEDSKRNGREPSGCHAGCDSENSGQGNSGFF